jgi:hypothetical protein
VDATRVQSREPQTMALMDKLKVNNLPALILLRRGAPLGHIEGNLPAPDLLNWATGAVGVTPGG